MFQRISFEKEPPSGESQAGSTWQSCSLIAYIAVNNNMSHVYVYVYIYIYICIYIYIERERDRYR